ncbi:MAG TPA: uroporphyrinogen-III synthase [Gillisia sp.]|nr:uroporphyrinogen-III synthase [Gillisia sp.]
MSTVLSTKKLSLSQKLLLLNAGIGLVEYDAIQIEFIDFKTGTRAFKNAVITSKNTAKAILKKDLKIENCYCVGEKTAAFLKENNFNIAEIADYGINLAQIIIEKYPNENFAFFCGNERRDELPAILKKNNVKFEELEVYKTSLKPKQFEREFEGILFFSPSGVKSFVSENKLDKSIAFCIGSTTASEAKKHTSNIIIANKPSLENVIVQAVKYFK